MWKNIYTISINIQFSFQYMVGSENHVNLYSDPWIFNCPLKWWPTLINMDFDVSQSTILDYIDNSCQWNIESLAHLFSTNLLHQIQAIPLPFLWSLPLFTK